jgi:hypothetical protein
MPKLPKASEMAFGNKPAARKKLGEMTTTWLGWQKEKRPHPLGDNMDAVRVGKTPD